MAQWDEHNIRHIAVHRVSVVEAEEALRDPRRVPARAYSTSTERRLAVLGETAQGRLLFVAYTYRGHGREQVVRVVTARDAHEKERPSYYVGGGPD